jgi:PAS domain S-box-containing protein
MNHTEQVLSKERDQFYTLLQSVEGIVWEAELDGFHFTFVSNYAKHILGSSPEEWLEQDHFWESHIYPDDKTEVLRNYKHKARETDNYSLEYRMVKANGDTVWIKDNVSVIKRKGKGTLLCGIMTDITKARQLSILEHLERDVLELNSRNEKPFKDVLLYYLRGVEVLFPEMKCSILQVKNNRLYDWASPSLPISYTQAIENLQISENSGSCGTSVFFKQKVIVSDIANDPRWALYKHLALPHQLLACWSHPIINSDGEVMATLGMYYHDVRTPNDEELKVIERVTALLKIILENRQKTEIIYETGLLISQSQELAGFGNWRWDVQNNKVTWSDSLYAIYGLNEKEFKATFEGYQELLHPEDRQRVYNIISNVLKEKVDAEFEERIIRPTGEIRYLKSWGKLKSDLNGLPIEMIGACLDITESRKTEEILKATTSRLAALVDAQTNYVIRIDLDGKYIYYNKKYQEDFDWILKGKDIADTDASITVQPYHRERVKKIVEKCIESPNHVFQIEFDKMQKDGSRRPTLWHFIGLSDSSGETAEIQCIGLDITSLRNTEQALKSSNERFEYVNKVTNDAILDWDIVTGKVKWGNGFFRLFGLDMSEDYTFEKWALQVHPSDIDKTQNSLLDSIKDQAQSNWRGEYRLRKADGDYIYVEGNGYIIRDESGNGIRMIGVIRDISERLNYLNAIEQQNKKLLDIAWMQSHEVRAPLAKIIALTDLIKSSAIESSEKSMTLEYLLSSAHQLDQIINAITKKIEQVSLKEKAC